MLRLLPATAVFLAVSGAALAADLPYPSQVRYAIYRGGHVIGQHTISFDHKGPLQIVTIDCDIDVRALGVSAYRYVHRGREEWNGGQLRSMRASTDDNGQRFTVAAEHRDGSLVVERTAPAKMPTAPPAAADSALVMSATNAAIRAARAVAATCHIRIVRIGFRSVRSIALVLFAP